MPIPIVIVLVVAFAASAVVLAVCAAVGFRQSVSARVVEGLAGLICVGNAVGVPFVDHVTICSGLWFVAPFVAVSNVRRIRQAEKLHQAQLASTYAAQEQDRQRQSRKDP